MSRNPYNLLQAELKKNKYPELKELYDNIEDITKDDIDSANIKPWMKKTLKKMIKRVSQGKNSEVLQGEVDTEALRRAESIAFTMRKKTQNNTVLKYDVYRYNGGNKVVKGKTYHIDVCTGDLICVLSNNEVRVNQTYTKVRNIQDILAYSEHLGNHTITEFNRLIQDMFDNTRYKAENAMHNVNQRISDAVRISR